MINKTGNSGHFFGGDINYCINDGFIMFTQPISGKCMAVRGTDPIKHINCPYYTTKNNKTVFFTKPAPFYVGEYEYGALYGTELQLLMIFGGKHVAESFISVFGTEYLKTGIITCGSRAIAWWNTYTVSNTRLALSVCNWIIANEFQYIRDFENRSIPLLKPPDIIPVAPIQIPRICTCPEKEPIVKYKYIFGPLWTLAKNSLCDGFKEPLLCKCANKSDKICFTIKDTDREFTLTVNTFRLDPQYPVLDKLIKPPPKKIPGVPWIVNDYYDCKLNNMDCHLDILKARGGELFKDAVQKVMVIPRNLKNLLDFIYLRAADVTDYKKELETAQYVKNAEYKDYIMNYLIETNLYAYYKFFNKL